MASNLLLVFVNKVNTELQSGMSNAFFFFFFVVICSLSRTGLVTIFLLCYLSLL